MNFARGVFYSVLLVWMGSAGAAAGGIPLPDDPAWRALGGPVVPFASMNEVSGAHGRYFAHGTFVDDSQISYSPDGVLWLEAPPGLTGRTGRDGEQLQFLALQAESGAVVQAFGVKLYQGDYPADWQLIAENQTWLSVQTALVGERIVRVGLVPMDDGVATLAATLDADGAWRETQLESGQSAYYGRRLMQTSSGLVYAGRNAFWSSADGIHWTVHGVPELLVDVPPTLIVGNGPFMVNHFGTAGSFEQGDFRTVSVFARSVDGLLWEDATTGSLNVQGALHFHAPWFAKEALAVIDGMPQSAMFLSLDGRDWDLFAPVAAKRVAMDSDHAAFSMGRWGSQVHVFDKAQPLEAPTVSAQDGAGGIQLSWNAIPGASYYVVQAQDWTLKTTVPEAFVAPRTVYTGVPIQQVSARVIAVSADGHPGIPSEPVSAQAFNADLPPPEAPASVRVDRMLGSLQFTLSWQSQGGTRLHDVAWTPSADGTAPEMIATAVSGGLISIPLEMLPPCQEVFLWVRGTNGSQSSDWAGPVAFFATDGNRPCPPQDLQAAIGADGEHFRITWTRLPFVSQYEVQRSRDSTDPGAFVPVASSNLGVYGDADAFFDTTYHYRIRSVATRWPLAPVYSEWSAPVTVSRPASGEEAIVLAFMGWTSLGNGRFMSGDFGGFQILREGSDWIRLDDGTHLFVGGLDERLNFIAYLPHPRIDWVAFPVGHWPDVYSPAAQGWFRIAPGGQWLWDFSAKRWVR